MKDKNRNNKKAVKEQKTKKPVSKTAKKDNPKIARADKLRIKNKADMQKLGQIQKEWEHKVDKAKNRADAKKIDVKYAARFKRQEEVEQKSYAAYYNYVSSNFTKAQQKAAMKSSGNFMNKSYINGLSRAVKNGEKQ